MLITDFEKKKRLVENWSYKNKNYKKRHANPKDSQSRDEFSKDKGSSYTMKVPTYESVASILYRRRNAELGVPQTKFDNIKLFIVR